MLSEAQVRGRANAELGLWWAPQTTAPEQLAAGPQPFHVGKKDLDQTESLCS